MAEDRDDNYTMPDMTEEMRMEWDVSEQELSLAALENVCNVMYLFYYNLPDRRPHIFAYASTPWSNFFEILG